MTAPVLPTRLDGALSAAAAYAARDGSGHDLQALEQVASMRATVTSWAAELAAAPGPSTIDHNDLHPWNILVRPRQADRSARFFDWGESVIAHPFASLLVLLTAAAEQLGLRHNTPLLHRLRDAYLEAFSDLASRRELVATVEPASRLAKIARALTWQRATSTLRPDQLPPDWARAPLASLIALLDESHLGGT